jgi:hypothetical protein
VGQSETDLAIKAKTPSVSDGNGRGIRSDSPGLLSGKSDLDPNEAAYDELRHTPVPQSLSEGFGSHLKRVKTT